MTSTRRGFFGTAVAAIGGLLGFKAAAAGAGKDEDWDEKIRATIKRNEELGYRGLSEIVDDDRLDDPFGDMWHVNRWKSLICDVCGYHSSPDFMHISNCIFKADGRIRKYPHGGEIRHRWCGPDADMTPPFAIEGQPTGQGQHWFKELEATIQNIHKKRMNAATKTAYQRGFADKTRLDQQ